MLSARETALKILYETHDKDGYLNIIFQNYMRDSKLRREDRALVKELVSGVQQHLILLDFVIRSYSKIRLKKISLYILEILRLGIYQLYFMEKIPASAAVNESVKLAKKYGHNSSAGFVNAILHRAAREEKIALPERGESDIKYLSVKYSHPEELVSWYIDTFGAERAEKLLAANNSRPPLSIRVNCLKTDREELAERLRAKGFETHPSEVTDCGLLVERGGNLEKLSEYQKGYFSIQGQSSQLAAIVLSPKPGDVVLDLCCAPGGKTAHMAELMHNEGKIFASDLYEHRLSAVKENAARLGISIIDARQMDAQQENAEYLGIADKILLDVPCSGLGIIRRKPDIKYKKGLTDVKELCEIQKNILNICSKYLKIEGELVYSTCTIDPKENEEMVREFLREHPDFRFVSGANVHMNERLQRELEKGYYTLMPDVDGCDGFFICKMKRGS